LQRFALIGLWVSQTQQNSIGTHTPAPSSPRGAQQPGSLLLHSLLSLQRAAQKASPLPLS